MKLLQIYCPSNQEKSMKNVTNYNVIGGKLQENYKL